MLPWHTYGAVVYLVQHTVGLIIVVAAGNPCRGVGGVFVGYIGTASIFTVLQ